MQRVLGRVPALERSGLSLQAGVPHVFARGPAVTNLNAQAPGLDPALFASGLALGTQNQGEPKMIQKKSAITSLVLADSASG
jgi:hypothetical protein